MPAVQGLTIVVVGANAERFAAAVAMACASAALGARTRLYADERAVALLAHGRVAGLDDARTLGVTVLACQTGLANARLTPEDLPPETELTGLVSVLAGLGDDRLVTI